MKLVVADLKTFILLFLASILLFILDFTHLTNFPKSLLQAITIPVQYGLYHSGVVAGGKLSTIISVRQAVKEHEALKRQFSDLMLENASLRKEIAIKEALLDQENTLKPETYNLISARVIGIGRFLVIDRGSDEGVAVGQAVVYKNHYVGQIKSLSPKSSQVILAEDPDSKVAVFSQNIAGKARGIISGQFGSESLMDKILHQEKIAVGDLVYSEGVEGTLPRGLVLGQVEEVIEQENEVFKQAKIKPIIDVKDLDLVFVMVNP